VCEGVDYGDTDVVVVGVLRERVRVWVQCIGGGLQNRSSRRGLMTRLPKYWASRASNT